MPPRPRAPRTRVSGIRRPRVAGTTPGAHTVTEHGDSRHGAVALDEAVRPSEDLLAEPTVEAEPVTVALTKPTRTRVRKEAVAEPEPVTSELAAEEPVPAPRPPLLQRRMAVPLLAVALVLLTGLAVFFALANARLNNTASARNTALVDMSATTAATGQLAAALKAAYSYDYARLDENERDARAGMTPAMADQFTKLFAQVRQLAPEQKSVVSATIVVAGAQSIVGDTAVAIFFMDQQATRTDKDGKTSQFFAPGRLTVVGKLIDGQWKIDSMEAR